MNNNTFPGYANYSKALNRCKHGCLHNKDKGHVISAEIWAENHETLMAARLNYFFASTTTYNYNNTAVDLFFHIIDLLVLIFQKGTPTILPKKTRL